MLASYYKRRPYKYSQEEENTESNAGENISDPCADLTEEVVECINTDQPNCEENTENTDGTINKNHNICLIDTNISIQPAYAIYLKRLVPAKVT